MKRRLAIVLAICLLITAAPLTFSAADAMKDSGLDYSESTAMLPNPHMGYPNSGQAADGAFRLLETGSTTINPLARSGFVWWYVNLREFSAGNEYRQGGLGAPVVGGTDKPLTAAALAAFQEGLEHLRRNGGSAFMRFVYDTSGNAGCEPGDFEMLLTHLRQLCGVVSQYPDVVRAFECRLVGPWGEMHSSKYVGGFYINRIIDTYLDNTPESMVLLLRNPGCIADYVGATREGLADFYPEKGTKAWRLGYYNDGYMNTDSDYGTWGDRETELKFLERQEHTPYGGEYGSDYARLPSNVCKPENAIPEMYRTHVSFMRGNVYSVNKPSGGKNGVWGYDQFAYAAAYEKPWFPDNAAFKAGADCFDFITAHIGYRLVLRKSELSQAPQAGGVLALRGRIENTGFAHVLHEPNAQVLLVKDGTAYACDVNLDAYDIRSCTTYDYDFALTLPANMAAGEYDVYLRLAHGWDSFYAAARSGIQFANAGGIFDEKLGANRLGAVTIAAAAQAGSAASDAFAQVNAPRAGAMAHRGAPALLGYGFSVGVRSISLSYNQGDDIALSALHLLPRGSGAAFEWKKDGVVVSTQPELVIPAITAADAGSYQLKVDADATFTTMMVHVAVTDHRFGPWETKTQPTCASTGRAVRACSDCPLAETAVLPALAHIPGAPAAIPGDCLTRARDAVSCTLCLTQLSAVVHEFGAHDYVTTITGSVVSGSCNICGDVIGPKDYDNAPPPGDAFTGAPLPFGTGKLQLIGPGGVTPSYQTRTDTTHMTFLFKVTGADSVITLAKLRALMYTRDRGPENPSDSNAAANYHGTLFWRVTQDGHWAYTVSSSVLNSNGNDMRIGGMTYFAFNDPSSTKAQDAAPVNANPNATFQLLGIYDGTLAYDIVFVDAAGKLLERHSGAYNSVGNQWANLLAQVKSAGELYRGPVPQKPSDGSFAYTFVGWADAQGNPIGAVVNDLIAYPVFTATPITMTDAEAVAEAKAALTWDSIRSANTAQANVTSNLVALPAAGAAGTAIAWASNNAAISNTGAVTRPAYGAGNAVVTLTASITKGAAGDTVTFTLTVPQLPDTTQPPVPVQISKNFSALNVRQAGKLTAAGATGFTSGNPAVASIDNQGNILGKRPGSTVITATTLTGQGTITVTVQYNFWQWLLVIFLFGWIWLPLK